MNPGIIGLDYGTDSVRAVLIDAITGKELASSVFWYPRWKAGKYCKPSINQFRQNPLDHIEGMEFTIKQVVSDSGLSPELIRGICIDTTGSSPVPVNKEGVPLAMTPEFAENDNAMMVLWKDHTSIVEAEAINELARTWGGEDYTKFEGGIYSSEWFWAKIWHIAKVDPAVCEAAYTWMEHCDLMPYLLIEEKDLAGFKRSRCAAGHKAMWHESWGGLPDAAFLRQMHPYLADLKARLYTDTYTSDQVAGNLSREWAEKLGLSTETIITVGTFDAHSGAVGAGISPNTLVRVMGTSTCDIIVSDYAQVGSKTVKGICGQVDGSVLPGMIGLEAGQSAFGDVLAWFKEVLLQPSQELIGQSQNLTEDQKTSLISEISSGLIPMLTEQARNLPVEESIPVALDWVNGRRTPDADQNLKAAMAGLSLGTKAPHIFKALIFAICFGSRKIAERFESEGVIIEKVVGIGGVARKSSYIMQSLADTLNKPIVVVSSDYAPALGAAVYAAVATGLAPDMATAVNRLASEVESSYTPDPAQVAIMDAYYQQYQNLADFIENSFKS